MTQQIPVMESVHAVHSTEFFGGPFDGSRVAILFFKSGCQCSQVHGVAMKIETARVLRELLGQILAAEDALAAQQAKEDGLG